LGVVGRTLGYETAVPPANEVCYLDGKDWRREEQIE
jgi:hypothetical protein